MKSLNKSNEKTELQEATNQVSTVIESSKLTEIAKQIYRLDVLMSYPLKDYQREDWAKCVNEVYPDMSIETLTGVVNDLRAMKIVWNRFEGVQNIISALNPNPGFKRVFTSGSWKLIPITNLTEY